MKEEYTAKKGAQSFKGQAGGKGDRMLLGNTDIEKTFGKLAGKGGQTSAGRHGGGDGHYPFILAGQAGKGAVLNTLV